MVAVFNNPQVVAQSWYFMALSQEVRPGQIISRELANRRIVIYRATSGRVFALEGRCAHLGADLGHGTVVGETLRCAFHHWAYAGDGQCVKIPYMEAIPSFAKAFAYPVEEKHGAVWVFNGPKPLFSIPTFSGREKNGLRVFLLRPQILNCHPHVATCNGLDIQHFKTVHRITFAEEPIVEELDAFRMQSRFRTRLIGLNVFEKLLRLLAGESLSTTFTTWGGNLATIDGQAGPLPLHVLFTHRPLAGGRSLSQTFFFVPRQYGLQRILKPEFLSGILAKLVTAYLLIGDRKILDHLRFQPHLVEADAPLAMFIRQVNRMAVFDPTCIQSNNTCPDTAEACVRTEVTHAV